METGFYVIILFLIFLKLMIWICVFYSRARRRQIITQRGLIIVQGDVSARPAGDRDVIINREHLPATSMVGVDNPVMTGLPSYDEVQRTKTMEEKPPSYEQVISGNFPQQGNVNSSVYMQSSGSSTAQSSSSTSQSPSSTGVGPTPAESNSQA